MLGCAGLGVVIRIGARAAAALARRGARAAGARLREAGRQGDPRTEQRHREGAPGGARTRHCRETLRHEITLPRTEFLHDDTQLATTLILISPLHIVRTGLF